MQYGIAFTPLVPSIVLWIALAAIAVISVLLLLGRSRGWAVRVTALALVLLALANPSFTREDREPLSSVAAVVIDKSPSQNFGQRTRETAQAQEALVDTLKKIKGLEVRVVEAGQADGETDGTKLFGALSSVLSDVPVDRVAGAFMITDGRVHDIPANAAALGFQAPVHALVTGRKDERDRRVAISAAPRFGIVGQPQTITYRLDDQGVTGERAKIIVRRDGEVINERTLQSGQTANVEVDIKHAGPNIVEIEASPMENELTLVNNRAVVAIDGVRDKLRVLLVSGEPHSGERTWRNILKSDAAIDLVHFTILRPPEKQDGTPINELSLIAFPTRELFQQKNQRLPVDHLRPLRPSGRAADRLFRQYRALCARRRRGAGVGGAGLCFDHFDLAHAAGYGAAGRAGRRHRKAVLCAAERRRQTPSGDARAGRLRQRAAALGPVLPLRGDTQRDQPAGHDRRRRQAAVAAVTLWRGPRRTLAVGSHLAVGARL